MGEQANQAMRGKGALKAKGRATRAAILDTAHEVFKTTGFYGSSISEITRRCGFSTGTFYQYFKNKEQVFQELNDLIITRFMKKIEAVTIDGLNFETRLRQVLQILYSHCKENLAFHTVLGESELLDSVTIAYYESIARYYRSFFRQEFQAGNIRAIDPSIIAYALIGICYFHSFDWDSDNEDFDESQIVDLISDFILRGINGPAPWKVKGERDLLKIPQPLAKKQSDNEPLTKGEKTRQSIFNAAEEVIGQYGINRANIFEITRKAGVAQGTFYVHFESKHELIEGFVKYFNHEMRAELQRFVAKTTDRRDAERVGILKFFEYTRKHRKIYRIVPECEIISREVSLWYYNKIAHGYIQGIRQGVESGEIRTLPPVFLARTLMGLTHFLALKLVIWDAGSRGMLSSQVQSDIINILIFGLNPSRQ
jgi:AcrR family transcriptional regulator